jgi:hypothetical protein
MVAVTYGSARIAAREAVKASRAEAVAREPWHTRFLNALMESRLRQAEREIARHLDLANYAVDERGHPQTDTPFGGW